MRGGLCICPPVGERWVGLHVCLMHNLNINCFTFSFINLYDVFLLQCQKKTKIDYGNPESFHYIIYYEKLIHLPTDFTIHISKHCNTHKKHCQSHIEEIYTFTFSKLRSRSYRVTTSFGITKALLTSF